MQYESPLGGSDLSAYADPNPALGTDGSVVRAPAIEHHLRELHYLIEQADLTPDRGDLTQVWQAITALISAATRPRLLADLDLYVSTAGNDSANGSIGAPFLTWNKAIAVAASYDLDGWEVNINVADGTYAVPVLCERPFLGGKVNFTGNLAAPQNVVLNPSAGNAFSVGYEGTRLGINGVSVGAPALQDGLTCYSGGYIEAGASMRFIAAGRYHMNATAGARLDLTHNYTIAGGAQAHWNSNEHGNVAASAGITVTLSGTPAFSDAFAKSDILGALHPVALTFSGAATGKRFSVNGNAVIQTSGSNPLTYLPGNVNGTQTNGGLYL